MPDYLSCGSCPVDFELADIVSFIEHKRQRCIDGSVDTDQLECFKCSKRFHTPWPLLFHIQVDHKILIVRNLDQMNLPLSFQTSIIPVIQNDGIITMEIDTRESELSTNYRDMSTQTVKSQTPMSCCKPMTPCCQKIEPQCYDKPCHCPSNVICTSEACFINLDDQQHMETNSNPPSCCVCPQGSVKKETREVQTEFEYNEEVDINFLLSNNSNEMVRDFNVGNIGNSYPQQTIPFTTQEYSSNFPINVEKNWGYYSHANGQINEHSNEQYFSNYNNQNYQMMTPSIRLPTNTDQSYEQPNSHLVVDCRPQSLASSPNHNIAPTTSNQSFSLLNLCTTDQSFTNQSSIFQDSNSSFHYKPQPINPDPQTIVSTIMLPHQSPIHNDSTPLFPRNDNCVLSFIPPGSVISSDFNTENLENEKLENERKEFRFLCSNCGKGFRQKVHLRKHVMSQHARQKPHKCSQCGYTTVEKSHLTVHIRTHTGERPYTCRRCSYSSAQNCTLKSHYLRRHPGDQIECTLCGSYFITEQERNNHQRSCRMVHGIPNSVGSISHSHNQSADHKTA